MLESGLALVAAGLPTLSYLFTTLSFRSVLQSARSALSLLPHRSSQKLAQSTQGFPDQYIDIDRQGSSSSEVLYVKRAERVPRSEYRLQDLRSSGSV